MSLIISKRLLSGICRGGHLVRNTPPKIQSPKIQSRVFHHQNGSRAMQDLKLDNLALRALPVDECGDNISRTVSGACFSLVNPTPVENPQLVAHSQNALKLVDLDSDSPEDLVEYLSGNKLLAGSKTAAHCYCGHQFGYFSGQLGDGAAIYLGDMVNKNGYRYELQLKGAGKTPFSRGSDGRKVLRSSIREFLCSEAMHHLGVPTTRAGTCITSDSRVVRDIFYDGNQQMERCTIVSRIAPCFIRFGSFEIFKPQDKFTGRTGPSVGRMEILQQLLEYVIDNFYPEIALAHPEDREERYMEFYKEVVRRTARLVAMWQCVGFCHGVLNTDNMSILGLTIDYGPYGFMDYFEPDFICNGSDKDGRYSYVEQPSMCKWNCVKLAEAIQSQLPLDKSRAALQEIYDGEFKREYYSIMCKKLGISKENESAEELVQHLLTVMKDSHADFTNTFRLLHSITVDEGSESEEESIVAKFISQCRSTDERKLLASTKTVDTGQLKMILTMAQSSPGILQSIGVTEQQLREEIEKQENRAPPENLTKEKIDEDISKSFNDWLIKYRKALQDDLDKLATDGEKETYKSERITTMKSNNPTIILRNHVAQSAIAEAEQGNYNQIQRVLELLEHPFSEEHEITRPQTSPKENSGASASSSAPGCSAEAADAAEEEVSRYFLKRPAWAADLRVT